MAARPVTLRIQPPVPFGEVTVVPASLSGRPEKDTAAAMAADVVDAEAPTAAEVCRSLAAVLPRRAAWRARAWRRRAS